MIKIYSQVLLVMFSPVIIMAQWNGSVSSIGKALHTSSSSQAFSEKLSVSDGSDGAIVVINEYVDASAALYAQRINKDGVLQWGSANSPKLIDANSYLNSILPDGEGGVFVAYTKEDDQRNDNVYLQRLNSAGNRLWPVGGIQVSNSTTSEIDENGDVKTSDDSYGAKLCSDGAGGVIVTWTTEVYDDENDVLSSLQAFAQKLNSSGTLLWGTGGSQLSTAAGMRALPEIVTDGAGGAIFFFIDNRNSDYFPDEDVEFPNIDIYGQRLNSAGNRMWSDAGVGVCNEPNIQFIDPDGKMFYAASDGAGGGIVVFQDYRTGNDGTANLYAQRVNGAGVKQWAAGGVVVCNASDEQYVNNVVSNGAQGIVVLWGDERSSNRRLYTQQVTSAGTAAWTANGVLISGTSETAGDGHVQPDGTGNYIYSWDNSAEILKAQKIDNDGVRLWGTSGIEVSNNSDFFFEQSEVVLSDMGKAIVTYNAPAQSRLTNGTYAKKLETSGVLPLTLLDFTTTPDKTRVKLNWITTSEINTRHFELERSSDNLAFKNIGKVNAAGNSAANRNYTFTDVSPLPGNNYYRLKQVDKDGSFTYSVVRNVKFGKTNSIALIGNPVKSEAILNFVSSKQQKIQIRMVDQLGRIVMLKQIAVEEGNNQLRLNMQSTAKGMYVVEVLASEWQQHVTLYKD